MGELVKPQEGFEGQEVTNDSDGTNLLIPSGTLQNCRFWPTPREAINKP